MTSYTSPKLYPGEDVHSPNLKERLMSDMPWAGTKYSTMIKFLRMIDFRDQSIADFAANSPRAVGQWAREESLPNLEHAKKVSLLAATAGSVLVATEASPDEVQPFFVAQRVEPETFEPYSLLDQFCEHENPKVIMNAALEQFGPASLLI